MSTEDLGTKVCWFHPWGPARCCPHLPTEFRQQAHNKQPRQWLLVEAGRHINTLAHTNTHPSMGPAQTLHIFPNGHLGDSGAALSPWNHEWKGLPTGLPGHTFSRFPTSPFTPLLPSLLPSPSLTLTHTHSSCHSGKQSMSACWGLLGANFLEHTIMEDCWAQGWLPLATSQITFPGSLWPPQRPQAVAIWYSHVDILLQPSLL